MVKTYCSTLHTVYNIQQSETQGSNDTTHRLSRRTAATTTFSPESIGCQKQTVPRFCQHPIRWAFTLQAFTRWRHLSTHPINRPATHLSTPEGRKLSWPRWLTCSGRFNHIVVTCRLQTERRTGSVLWPKTGILPTVLHNQPWLHSVQHRETLHPVTAKLHDITTAFSQPSAECINT